MVSRLTAGDGQGIPLVRYPVGVIADDVFGAGRAPVIEFDAFCEFMRFVGVPQIKDAEPDGVPFLRSQFCKSDWVDDVDRVSALQRAVVLEWYDGDLDSDCKDMLEQLDRDLQLMGNGDSEVRRSWEQAMRRLLNGAERRKIRAQHLANS
jgi:hypothetical protein